MVKNLVLVLYKSRPDGWSNWQIKVTQTEPSRDADLIPDDRGEPAVIIQEEGEEVEPGSPHYSPRHLPEFYADECNGLVS